MAFKKNKTFTFDMNFKIMELQNIDAFTKPNDLKKYVKEIMQYVMSKYFGGWPAFSARVNEIIAADHSLKHVEVRDFSTWRRKQQKTLIEDTDTPYYWRELYSCILLKIIEENGGDTANSKKSIHDKIHQSKEKKTIVRYGVFPCQDTILPLFFEELYNDVDFGVDFITFDNWNDGLDAFQNNKIDVALHNFPTAVSFNSRLDSKSPLFFWPFFSFNGYSFWVRTSAIKEFIRKNRINKSGFEKWSKDEKKKFFSQAKILVEGKTDFEWVLIDYLRKLEFTPPEIFNISNKWNKEYNTNEAKRIFVSEKDYAGYVTNPIHTLDLKQQKYRGAFTLLLHGNDFTSHNNFNGLICSGEYYKAHENIIHKLIEKWFLHTAALKRKIDQLTKKNPLITSKQSVSITIPSLIAFLNKETASDIEGEHLQYIYDASYNKFYDNHSTAFRDFYEIDLANEKIIGNYVGITEMELSINSQSPEAIKEVINAIKNNMIYL